MTCVPADLAVDFKRCCMLSGEFDGSDRDYFFQVDGDTTSMDEAIGIRPKGKPPAWRWGAANDYSAYAHS